MAQSKLHEGLGVQVKARYLIQQRCSGGPEISCSHWKSSNVSKNNAAKKSGTKSLPSGVKDTLPVIENVLW